MSGHDMHDVAIISGQRGESLFLLDLTLGISLYCTILASDRDGGSPQPKIHNDN